MEEIGQRLKVERCGEYIVISGLDKDRGSFELVLKLKTAFNLIKAIKSEGSKKGEVKITNVADQADLAVLSILRQSKKAISPIDMQVALRKVGIPESEARVAVIRLADEGKICIRDDRQIELVKKG